MAMSSILWQTDIVAVSLFCISFFVGRTGIQLARSESYGNPHISPIQTTTTTTTRPIHNDSYYLKHAHQIRLSLDPPSQSNFRVVCILLLENGSVTVGTNDECTPNINGSICAERAALLAYRMQFTKQSIFRIYIVTDSETPIPPGTLCREYLHGHFATRPETVLVLQSKELSSIPWIVSLKELYPYPSIYSGHSAQEQLALGSRLEASMEQEIVRLLSSVMVPTNLLLMLTDQLVIRRLLQAAHQASLEDDRDALHPIRYGAAMVMQCGGGGDDDDRLEILQASQKKALEYGSTQDAVCQLLALLNMKERRHGGGAITNKKQQQDDNSPIQVLCIVQVDQFGIPHVPFAAARSMLVEHGLGHVQVILTTSTTDATTHPYDYSNSNNDDADAGAMRVISVPAHSLCPFVPDFCKESTTKAL
jgi:cytidine deaminase